MAKREDGTVVRNAGQTRERIFRAAKSIAAQDGIAGLTTKRLCERANVSNGTFFYHFKTKSELLSFFLQEGFDRYYEERKTGIDPSLGTSARVIAGFEVYVDYCLQTGVDFMRAYYVGSNAALDGRPEALGREFLNRQMEDAAEALSHEVGEELGGTVARGCCTVVKGCVFEWCVANGELDLTTHVREMLEAYLAGALAR